MRGSKVGNYSVAEAVRLTFPRRQLYALLHKPLGYPVVRPNTPVLPYGAPSKQAAFVDPTARIINGYAVIVSSPAFIAPYSTLNAHGGIIKIGNGSDILDNATIIANPLHPHTAPAPEVLIGNQVLVGYGAKILGPSIVGAYGASGKPTEIGPGAVIDQATIEPGAIVGAWRASAPASRCRAAMPSCPARTSPRTPRPRTRRWAWWCRSRVAISST